MGNDLSFRTYFEAVLTQMRGQDNSKSCEWSAGFSGVVGDT